MRSICFLLAFCFAVLCVVGCGGAGAVSRASTSGQYVKVQVPIQWAQRARDIGGPESALSVVVTIQGAGQGGVDVTMAADRLSSPAAYSQTYQTSLLASMGVHPVAITFYAQAGGTGSVVGVASAQLDVLSGGVLAMANGSPLNSLATSGTVASVTLAKPTAYVGQATSLGVSAYDSNRNLVVVSPGSISYTLTANTGSATINSNGQLVGATVGTATLTAWIDGVSSSSVLFQVNPPTLSVTQMNQAVTQMVLDQQTGHLWASVPEWDPNYPNSVIEIDPAAEKVLTSIPVGSEPGALAISSDGTTLYVGLNGAELISKVDLIGKKLSAI